MKRLSEPPPPFGKKLMGLDPKVNQKIYMGYEADLARQLEHWGFPIPDWNLFPEKEAADGEYQNGFFVYPWADRRYPHGLVKGVSFKEASRGLLGRVTVDDILARRVLVALHELFHHVFEQLGIKNELLQTMYAHATDDVAEEYGGFDVERTTKLDDNLAERFSDAAAIMYLLSNYEGDASNAISCFMAFRSAYVSVRHNTASTVEKIMPSIIPGLDIGVCSVLVQGVISQQTDIQVDQYRAVLARSLLLDDYDEGDPFRRNWGNFDIKGLSKKVRAEVKQELARRHMPFRNGPLPVNLPSGTVMWDGPQPGL